MNEAFWNWFNGDEDNNFANNGDDGSDGNSVLESVLGWSAFGMNEAGDLGRNADNILKDRGKYMTPGKIYKLKYHPITVRFAIGGIETTSQVLNVIRVGGKWFGGIGNVITGIDVGKEIYEGNYGVAAGKAVFAVAEGAAIVFIPGFGWAVSLGLGVVEQLIFD